MSPPPNAPVTIPLHLHTPWYHPVPPGYLRRGRVQRMRG